MRYKLNTLFIAGAVISLASKPAAGQTLQQALDATNLTWTTSGFEASGWRGETNVTYDGVSAAESAQVSGSATSTLQTTVTGPGTLTFWYYVPEQDGSAVLNFAVNGVTKLSLGQNTISWEQQPVYLGSGTQTLTWTYKDSSSLVFYPAYMDQVSWVTGTTAPIITNQPMSQSQVQGCNTTFSVGAEGTPPLSYQWYFNSNLITGATSTSYTVTNVQPANLGYYSVTITNVAGGTNSANATLEFGNVTGWGNNHFFQTSIPPGTTNVLAISAGGAQNIALNSDGSLLAWGLNNYGQQSIPANLSNIAAVGANVGNSMVITSDGSLIEWGNNSFGQTNAAAGLSNVVAVASGDTDASLVLQSDGTASFTGPSIPGSTNMPANLSNVVAIASANVVYMALQSDGTISIWGSVSSTNVPTDLSNAVAIAAGQFGYLALKPDRTVEAWGDNEGTGFTNVPPGLSNVVAIAAGFGHCLALKADGTVVAWGLNTSGETNVPAGLSNVVQIAAGANWNIALVRNGPPVMSAPIQNPALAPNGFTFSIASQSGRVYALEYKNNLTDPGWTALPLVAGNGTNLVMTDPTATNSQRFYRVRRW